MNRRPLPVTVHARELRLEHAVGENVIEILAIPSRTTQADGDPL
jgi:hypothetical protein